MAGSGVVYDTRRKLQAFAARILPPETMNCIYTKILCSYCPNIKNPKTFNEKLQWLKLYYFPEHQDVIDRTDKYKVRHILIQMGLESILPKLLFVTDDLKDIPWDDLPRQFVIKCNHGCAYNIICSDKDFFDIKGGIKKLKAWLKQDFGLYNIEPHYSKIERKIFAEEYLGDMLIDYKFFCFHGEPRFLYVSEDLAHDSIARMAFYDMEFNKIPLERKDYADFDKAEKPECFEELVALARRLAKPFPFVRTDFYVINGKPIFSEFTFTPGACMMPVTPSSFDIEWGEMLDLSRIVI